MESKAIGFVDGNLCFRYENNNYYEIDIEKHLPYIEQGINNWLLKNTSLSNISRIIFDVLKDVFKTTTIFKVPGKATIVPSKSELYSYLENYIKSNPLYKEKITRSEKHRILTKDGKEKHQKRNLAYCEYRRVKSDKLDALERAKRF